jgi:hypothetical protein
MSGINLIAEQLDERIHRVVLDAFTQAPNGLYNRVPGQNAPHCAAET